MIDRERFGEGYCPIKVVGIEVVDSDTAREGAELGIQYQMRDILTGGVAEGAPLRARSSIVVGYPYGGGPSRERPLVYAEVHGWALCLKVEGAKVSVDHLATDDEAGGLFSRWIAYDNETGRPVLESGARDKGETSPSFSESGAKNPLGGDPDSPTQQFSAEEAGAGTIPSEQMGEWNLPHPVFTMNDMGYDQTPFRIPTLPELPEDVGEEPEWEDPDDGGEWWPGDWADERDYPQDTAPAEDYYFNEHVYPPVQELVESLVWSGIPVYLTGPAGCGKSELVRSASERLGMAFHYSNAIQQEYKLNGFIDAGGTYHETEFYRACVERGESVFMIDEADASIPEALITINAAMGNGYHEFPVGMVPVEGVHFVACGNTTGDGSDDMYTARAVLDQATMDRFAVVRMGYCREVEMALARGDRALVEFMERLRRAADQNGIRATFSYRTIQNMVALKGMDLPLTQALEAVVLKGLPPEHVRVLSRDVGRDVHPYADALFVVASRDVPKTKF